MKKLHVLLTFASSAAVLCASVAFAIDGPHIYIYIFVALGMILSVLAYIAMKREIAQRRRLLFQPLVPSPTEQEWIESMNQQARDIAISHAIPAQSSGKIEERQ
jgi:hypothetical protein